MLAKTATKQREIIGERVLLQRRRVRASQRAVSAAIGRGPNRVSDIELAKIDIDIHELYELARVLGCDPNYLMGFTDEPGSVVQEAIPGLFSELSYPHPPADNVRAFPTVQTPPREIPTGLAA